MKIVRSLLVAASVLSTVAFTPMTLAEQMAQPKAAVSQQAQKQQASSVTKVNINSADAAVLAERLNGIGEKKAQAIIEHREKNGPFKSVDELKNVSGIGDATLEKNRDLLSVE